MSMGMSSYDVWYIYRVSSINGCYYYCSTANPGPEGGQWVNSVNNSMEAHRLVRELNVRGSF